MGRHCGHIAMYTGIASGAGNVLVPEIDANLDELIHTFKEGTQTRQTLSR